MTGDARILVLMATYNGQAHLAEPVSYTHLNVAGKPPRHERDAAISQMPDTISPVGERIDANCLGVHVRLDRRHDDGPPKGTLPL